MGHRVVIGSHHQTKHKKAQKKNTKIRRKTIRKNEGTLHVTGIKQQVLYAEKEAKHENCGRKERVKNLNSRGVAQIFQRTNRKQAEGRNA